MKKALSAAAAVGVFAMCAAGAAQSDVLNSAIVWTNQPNAQSLAGCTPTTIAACVNAPAAGTLIPPISAQTLFFDSSNNTITGFATAPFGGGFSWTPSSAALGAMQLQNNVPAGPGSTGTIFEFTGTITGTGTLTIDHDDGVRLFIDGVERPNLTATATSQIFEAAGTLTAGDHTFALFYGECCNLPAILEFLKDGGPITNTGVPSLVPEPASLALLGAGLFGLGVLRRRRRTS